MNPYRDIADSIPPAPRAKALLKRALAYCIVFLAAEVLLTFIFAACGTVTSLRVTIAVGVGNAIVATIAVVRWAILTLFFEADSCCAECRAKTGHKLSCGQSSGQRIEGAARSKT